MRAWHAPIISLRSRLESAPRIISKGEDEGRSLFLLLFLATDTTDDREFILLGTFSFFLRASTKFFDESYKSFMFFVFTACLIITRWLCPSPFCLLLVEYDRKLKMSPGLEERSGGDTDDDRPPVAGETGEESRGAI